MLHFGALPPWLFSSLAALTSLELQNCGVTALPAELSRMSKLRKLSILSKEARGVDPPLDQPQQVCTCLLQIKSCALGDEACKQA